MACGRAGIGLGALHTAANQCRLDLDYLPVGRESAQDRARHRTEAAARMFGEKAHTTRCRMTDFPKPPFPPQQQPVPGPDRPDDPATRSRRGQLPEGRPLARQDGAIDRRRFGYPVPRIGNAAPYRVVIEANMHAVAVELDLVQPFRTVRRRVDELGQLRPDPFRQSGIGLCQGNRLARE